MRKFAFICGHLIFSFFILAPNFVFAWGSVGHQAVAYIAFDHLTPAVKEAVRAILNPDEDLVTVSTWADRVALTRLETGPWHYIQIEVRQVQNRYDLADVCRGHNCVVDQIQKDINILKERFASKRDKREALKFLVHFVGDLHQPLHCAEDGDRGGNDKWFRYYGPDGKARRYKWVNLHSFWDNLLEPKAKEDPRELALKLEKEVTKDDERDWSRGTSTDWAYESFKIAKEDIYSELPAGPLPEKNRWGASLPEDYYSPKKRKIVDRQLEKAGIRLAYILNEVFKNR